MGALEKPKEGSPCNGCGLCCKIVPCRLARNMVGAREGPCPALEFEGDRYWCGLIRNAHLYIYGMREKPWINPAIAEIILATGGFQGICDSTD